MTDTSYEMEEQRLSVIHSKLIAIHTYIAIIDKMNEKSVEMQNGVFLKQKWLKYCSEQKERYLAMLFGYNRFMMKIKSFLLKILHPQNEVMRALLLVQCETHREVLNTIFRDERNRKSGSMKRNKS